MTVMRRRDESLSAARRVEGPVEPRTERFDVGGVDGGAAPDAQPRRGIAIAADVIGGVLRLEGFCDVLGRRAAKRLIEHGDYTQRSGEIAMARLLERAPDIDAVFVGSDLMAAGALTALRAAGRRVPDDVAVGGFDDSAVALTTHPPLTTVRQPLERVAEETVRLLLELIDGARPDHPVILPTELVVRESA